MSPAPCSSHADCGHDRVEIEKLLHVEPEPHRLARLEMLAPARSARSATRRRSRQSARPLRPAPRRFRRAHRTICAADPPFADMARAAALCPPATSPLQPSPALPAATRSSRKKGYPSSDRSMSAPPSRDSRHGTSLIEGWPRWRGHKDAAGPLEDFARAAHLNQPAIAHDADPVAQRQRLGIIMGHIDGRHPAQLFAACGTGGAAHGGSWRRDG